MAPVHLGRVVQELFAGFLASVVRISYCCSKMHRQDALTPPAEGQGAVSCKMALPLYEEA